MKFKIAQLEEEYNLFLKTHSSPEYSLSGRKGDWQYIKQLETALEPYAIQRAFRRIYGNMHDLKPDFGSEMDRFVVDGELSLEKGIVVY